MLTLHTPGEHPFFFEGQVGRLEGLIMVPEQRVGSLIALLAHPHPLHGGSMSNKVITTLARTFREQGIVSIRFNFRGVGQSEGQFDEGVGESEDMLLLMRQVLAEAPSAQLILAGFSFGSYVAYRVSTMLSTRQLLTIAPPVMRYDYQAMGQPLAPWVIFQGEEDEVVDAAEVGAFAANHQPPIPLIAFPGAGHFFHGQLLVLKEKVIQILPERGA